MNQAMANMKVNSQTSAQNMNQRHNSLYNNRYIHKGSPSLTIFSFLLSTCFDSRIISSLVPFVHATHHWVPPVWSCGRIVLIGGCFRSNTVTTPLYLTTSRQTRYFCSRPGSKRWREAERQSSGILPTPRRRGTHTSERGGSTTGRGKYRAPTTYWYNLNINLTY